MMRAHLPAPVLRALQVCIAIGLLWVVWHIADGANAVRMLAGANPAWLAAAMAVLTLQTVLSALRWQLTATQLGVHLDRTTALREYYLSQFINQSLPGGIIGDAGRAVRTRQAAGLMAAGQAVVFERLAGQTALFLVMTVAALTTFLIPGGLVWPRWAVWSVAGIVVTGLALPCLFWVLSRAPQKGALKKLTEQKIALLHALAAPEVRVRQVAFSLGTVLCNVAGFGFCAWAVGVALPIPAMLAVIPLILFVMVIPITISGWGLREGAAAALFPVAGASASDGLATSIAFGLVFLATVLPGFILLGLGTGLRPKKF